MFFGVKLNIFKKWIYNTDRKNCAILTLGIINFVGSSKSMTFMFFMFNTCTRIGTLSNTGDS
jgi:hypothetical protein